MLLGTLTYVAQSYSDWLWAGRPRGRSLSPSRGKIFLLSTMSRPVLEPIQSPMQWVQAAFSQGMKRPEREADYSPSSSAEVKNGEAIPPLPISFHNVTF
jgi:hypothetical protein